MLHSAFPSERSAHVASIHDREVPSRVETLINAHSEDISLCASFCGNGTCRFQAVVLPDVQSGDTVSVSVLRTFMVDLYINKKIFHIFISRTIYSKKAKHTI